MNESRGSDGGTNPPTRFTLRKGDVFGELALFPDLLAKVPELERKTQRRAGPGGRWESAGMG